MTKEEKKQYMKNWRKKNKDSVGEYEKNYRENNKEEIKKRQKNWIKNNEDYFKSDKIVNYCSNYRKENKEKICESKKVFYQNNKEKIKSDSKKYYENNKDYVNEYLKNKKINNPTFRLSCLLRSAISESIKRCHHNKKSKRTTDIIGCSFKDFKLYIESKWEPWMSWDNYGSVNKKPPTGLNQCWDIDHIIPISSVNTEDGIIKLNYYTNLQPLCSYINRYIKREN